MRTFDRIKRLCQNHLSLGEIEQLIQFLSALRRKKVKFFQQQKSLLSIPIRPGWEVLEQKHDGPVIYRRERRRCGKVNFHCTNGLLNGPHWYAYYRRDNRLISRYIGETFRPISAISGQVNVKMGRHVQQ